jgi:hypothetical protein
MIQAAFGKFDYTPPIGQRLGRMGVNVLVAQGVQWPLYVRVALFDDGLRRVAVVVVDRGSLSAGIVAMLRESLQSGAGVAPECCMVAATHTHNGPALMPWRIGDDEFALAGSIAQRLCELGKTLAGQLAPVRLLAAQTAAPGWSWNRRPIYRDTTGRHRVGTHGRRDGEDFVGMEGADESALQVLLALREDGSAMGGLVNFWCHPTAMYNEPVWSADFPGPMLDRLEQQFGGDWVHLTGPCGDLSNNCGLTDGVTRRGPEYCRLMGEALADKTIAALQSPQPVSGQNVCSTREILSIAQRMTTMAQVETAREYLDEHRGQILQPSLMQRLHGWPFHFHHSSVAVDEWLANEVLGMWEWQKRVAVRTVREAVEIQGIMIGDLALVSVPCELFSALGHEIIDHSPIRRTWAVEHANGMFGYVPPQDAFERGGYECCLGYQSRLEPQAGHLMVEAALRLLTQMNGQQSVSQATHYQI